jgi:predicted RNase H-like nuclease
LDNVETILAENISNKRNEVFKALLEYKSLNEEVKETLPRIKELRITIKKLEKKLVIEPLKLNEMMKKRGNILKLVKILENLSTVHSTVQLIKEQSETMPLSTFDLIDESKHILKKDLAGIKCVKSMEEVLGQLSIDINKNLMNDFIKISISNCIENKEVYKETIKGKNLNLN